MTIKGGIFDMDGTLLDSMSIWRNIGIDYLLKLGIQPKPDLFDRLRVLSLTEAADYMRVDYRLEKPTEQVMREIDAMIEDFYFNTAPKKDGVVAFLDRLKAQGTRMVIATATDRYLVEAALKRTGLYGYFERIYTCTEVGKGKEHPDIFEQALAHLGTPKESTYIFEDSYYAIVTAKKAGFPVFAVWDRFSAGQNAAIRELSDIYIDDFAQAEQINL